MADAVADLVSLLDDHLYLEKVALLGYSMGGRLALHFAIAHPERLWALVLESASPGIESEEERRARVESDNALAGSIERDGLEAFVDRWQAQPLFASQQKTLSTRARERQRQQRLSCSPLGLANSLRGMGAGRQEWLLPRLQGFDVPALLLAGEHDEKYRGLLDRMQPALARGRSLVIPDAGHAAHLEQPGIFARNVIHFLADVPKMK
jgi:2-succinyl-6-hydroxy-2,4-cyclohexadiene-1-carboxylate synthase